MLRITRPQGINQPRPPGSPHPPPRPLTGPSSVLKSTHCLLGLGLCMCPSLLRALLSPLPLANFPSSPRSHPKCTGSRAFLNSLDKGKVFPLGSRRGLCFPFIHSHHIYSFLCVTCLPCHTISSTKIGLVGGLEHHTVFQLSKSGS